MSWFFNAARLARYVFSPRLKLDVPPGPAITSARRSCVFIRGARCAKCPPIVAFPRSRIRTSAPRSSNASSVSRRSKHALNIAAVDPSQSSTASISHPNSTSARTASVFPYAAAWCNARRPSSSPISKCLTPAMRASSRINATSPRCAASIPLVAPPEIHSLVLVSTCPMRRASTLATGMTASTRRAWGFSHANQASRHSEGSFATVRLTSSDDADEDAYACVRTRRVSATH